MPQLFCARGFGGNGSSRVFSEPMRRLLGTAEISAVKELNGWKLTHPLKTCPKTILKCWAGVSPGTERFWGQMVRCRERRQRRSPAWEPFLQDGSVMSDSPMSHCGESAHSKPNVGNEVSSSNWAPGLGQDFMLLVILCKE